MLKNIVRLEFTVADKVYHFMCDNDAPIEHIKEALFQCQKYIGQVEDNIRAQIEAQKVAEIKVPDDPPVEAQDVQS
jgi:hypothetical protein